MGGKTGELLQAARDFVCVGAFGAMVAESEAGGEEVGESVVDDGGVIELCFCEIFLRHSFVKSPFERTRIVAYQPLLPHVFFAPDFADPFWQFLCGSEEVGA